MRVGGGGGDTKILNSSGLRQHNIRMYNIKLDIGFEICLILHLSVIKLLVFLNIHFKWVIVQPWCEFVVKIYTKIQKFEVSTISIYVFIYK